MARYIGTSGDDRFEGTGYAWDYADGGAGNDVMHGHDGNDTLKGGRHHDRLYGGDGDDLLIGGEGTDLLTGGDGADHFMLVQQRGLGLDTVTDFDFAEGDRIRINTENGTENNLNDLDLRISAHSQNSNHTNILFEGEVLMTLQNVSADILSELSFSDLFEIT